MKTDQTKKPGVFSYISLGDVHLGHRQTPATHIIRNLNRMIHDELLKTLDAVFITGDLFDRQLNNGDEDVHGVYGKTFLDDMGHPLYTLEGVANQVTGEMPVAKDETQFVSAGYIDED